MTNGNHINRRRASRRRTGRLLSHFLLYLVVVAILAGINAAQSPGVWWVGWPALGLGLALLAFTWRAYVAPYLTGILEERRYRGNRS